MSAKLIYNLSDENPNLHKQIGCMNGIFHVFYRHHYPTRQVLGHGHGHNTLPPPGETNDEICESNLAYKEMEKPKKKVTKEKQRVSTESSSRPSFSSSPRSSSFSSADVSTVSQIEPPIYGTNSIREAPDVSPLTQYDLRELVKGSIHRDTRANTARASVSLLKESLRSPSRNSSEWNEGRRVTHLKDSPRFSYDERELRSNGYKTATKTREPPRLSLDSRSNSFRSSRTDVRSNSLLDDGNGQQEPGTHRRTTSSVVAKLMGLDVLPDDTTSEHDFLSGQCITSDNNRQNRFCDSPRPSYVDAARQRSRGGAEPTKNMTPASKFPMEPAPWKQMDGAKGQHPSQKTEAKTAESTLTVYGEIQKRLTHLEFKKSGKDLRALKQILEAMEKTQQLIDGRRDDTQSSSNRFTPVQKTQQQPSPVVTAATSPSMNFRSSIVIMKPAQVHQESGNTTSNVALPNLQVGHSRQIRKGMHGKQTAMDLTPRPGLYKGQPDFATKNTKGGSLRPKQISMESCSPKSDIAKSGRSQHNVGLRVQQKKLGFEGQSQPTTPTSEVTKNPRQIGRQQKKVASPRRTKGTKNVQLSDTSSDQRSLSHHSDARSSRSDSNISSVPNADTEVTSRNRFEKPIDASEQQTPKQMSPELGFKQDRPMLKPVKVTMEQPSPVSVLDATFYEDESPSPVRKISTVFKDEHVLSAEEPEWIKEDTNQTPTGFRRSIVLPENNQRLTHTDSDLVECLMGEGAMNNADHKYIAEILLASGLLRDLEYSMISIQLHQSRLPINPNLFFVLEQNQTNDVILQDRHRGKGIRQIHHTEKIRRKLMFDTVNEILAQRFVAEGCIKPHIKSSPLMEKRSRGKYLLQTLCSDIDQLQANNSKCSLDDDEDIIWKDLQNQGMCESNLEGETPAIVLDIERMIFKDLINDVVTSEVTAVRRTLSRQYSQFSF